MSKVVLKQAQIKAGFCFIYGFNLKEPCLTTSAVETKAAWCTQSASWLFFLRVANFFFQCCCFLSLFEQFPSISRRIGKRSNRFSWHKKSISRLLFMSIDIGLLVAYWFIWWKIFVTVIIAKRLKSEYKIPARRSYLSNIMSRLHTRAAPFFSHVNEIN